MSKWIVLRDGEGNERREPFDPGARVTARPDERMVRIEEGTGLGDLVQRAIEYLPQVIRPKHCGKCEKRKKTLNKVRIS